MTRTRYQVSTFLMALASLTSCGDAEDTQAYGRRGIVYEIHDDAWVQCDRDKYKRSNETMLDITFYSLDSPAGENLMPIFEAEIVRATSDGSIFIHREEVKVDGIPAVTAGFIRMNGDGDRRYICDTVFILDNYIFGISILQLKPFTLQVCQDILETIEIKDNPDFLTSQAEDGIKTCESVYDLSKE